MPLKSQEDDTSSPCLELLFNPPSLGLTSFPVLLAQFSKVFPQVPSPTSSDLCFKFGFWMTPAYINPKPRHTFSSTSAGMSFCSVSYVAGYVRYRSQTQASGVTQITRSDKYTKLYEKEI